MSQERRPLLPRDSGSSAPHSEQESFSSSSRTYVTEVREEIPAIPPEVQVKWDTVLFYNLLVDSLPGQCPDKSTRTLSDTRHRP
jgi:hypothetical protein